MNILVIGNGFDLAHGLPTRYTEFLDWVRSISMIGERLIWVDEIPSDVEEAKEWLSNESLPKIWGIKFVDDFMTDYLNAELKTRLEIEKTTEFTNWMDEHKINYRDKAFFEDRIHNALKRDDRDKSIKADSALESLMKVIARLKYIGKLNNGSILENFCDGLKKKSIIIYQEERNKIAVKGNEYRDFSNFLRYKHLDYLLKNIFYLIKENFWLLYFLDVTKISSNTWIDFEKEISKVIQRCSNYMKEKDI